MRNYKGPLFQHRHYAEIARVVADTRGDNRQALINGLVSLFIGDNDNFDLGRFEAACASAPIKAKDKR